jgi:hypothetical protein
MYVHTHWGYNRPYAARSWTKEDWEQYLGGLRGLGYDTVMIWPQIGVMPLEPTASDRKWLALLGSAIDLAHDRFGMKTIIIESPNTMGNDLAAGYDFQNRPWFVCEKKVNPRDPAEVRTFLAQRRACFAPLARADAFAVIDSDPGGYIGSTNPEFVELCRGQIEVFREFNPRAEFVYWMLCGWDNYNRFWEKAQKNEHADMWADWPGTDFKETLGLMRERIPEPWWVLAWLPQHQEAVDLLGLRDKAMFYPYGTVEGEPTFPLTNCAPTAVANLLPPEMLARHSLGAMANAQTHCLQLPHTYLFAHFAKGGSLESEDLTGFADEVLPGFGEMIARGWSALQSGDPAIQRAVAVELREASKRHAVPGRLGGLLFGDAKRFLVDLAINLELWPTLTEFAAAVDTGQNAPQALRRVLDVLRPYQERLGYKDAYGNRAINDPLGRLGDPGLDAVLKLFGDWRHPEVRNGLAVRLFDAAEAFCRSKGV